MNGSGDEFTLQKEELPISVGMKGSVSSLNKEVDEVEEGEILQVKMTPTRVMNNYLLLSKKGDEKESNNLQEIDSGSPAEGVDDKNIDEEGTMQVPIQDLPFEELRAAVSSLEDIPPDIFQEAFEVAKE
ncbi:hypothetical protein K7X08_000815 [Anisodus acutangulus]|uniref:Uncharacterized protein n=1 Tax=Anisodus acutangulus TaxID=402998 RepID=A0A9Q1MR26_9SOLA|nr:hypothetical protein K7X08_000815 [Anisodus acutangulus]